MFNKRINRSFEEGIMSKKAIVLLSGGLDSVTCLAIAKREGYETYALSFNYGQNHSDELECAAYNAKKFQVVEHRIVKLDPNAFKGSALTDNFEIPKNKPESEIGSSIPITYVPARNTVFLSFALGWCEVLKCYDIFIGVNSVDFSGYPDCTPEFIAEFEKMANIAASITKSTDRKIKIHAPLENMSKKEIILTGIAAGVDYSKTITCYDHTSDGACGECESCILRLRGFKDAGLEDPAVYRSRR